MKKMPITTVDKIKIAKYLKETPIDYLRYAQMCGYLAKKVKIKDDEFLAFFVDSVVNEFRKNGKISIKQVTKYVAIVGVFLEKIHEDGVEVDEKVLDSIRSFEDYYDEYLNRTDYDIDLEFTDGVLASVLKIVNELYPTTANNESLVQYLNEIDDLKQKLERLQKEFDDLTARYAFFRKEFDSKTQCLNEKKAENSNLKTTITNKDREIEQLKRKIDGLKSLLEQAKTDLGYYKPFEASYEAAMAEIVKLSEQVESRNLQEQERAKNEEIEEIVASLIYEKLLEEKVDTKVLVDFVNSKEEENLSKQRIYSILNGLRRKINIETGSFLAAPSYQIVAPKIVENGLFTIDVPYDSEYYDILLVSDFHLTEIDDKVLKGFDAINNYCVNNKIDIVMNLGDFFEGIVGNKQGDYETVMQNYRLVEKAISLIPRADGIYHAVLGGNHDKSLLKYGYDPIGMLTQEREDFINLGYTHSTIVLNGFNGILGQFDIHHPHTFDLPLTSQNKSIEGDNLLLYLNELHNSLSRCRDDSSIDILGHTHEIHFNFPDSYCYVPAYFVGKNKRGAWHLRVYFDDNSCIKNMLFMSLTGDNKLIKNNQLVYKKVLSRE